MTNKLTIDSLHQCDMAQLLDLPIEQIKDVTDAIEALETKLKGAKAWVQAYMELRFGTAANNLRQQSGRATGTQHVQCDDFVVSATTKPNIKWDQELMADAASTISRMDGVNVFDIVKVDYSVSETVFKNCRPDIRALLEKARSVSPSKQSFEIKQQKG